MGPRQFRKANEGKYKPFSANKEEKEEVEKIISENINKVKISLFSKKQRKIYEYDCQANE